MAIFINEGEVYMILNGLSKKIKAQYLLNSIEDGDYLYITDGNGKIKSTVANTDLEKAKLNYSQAELIKRYNKKYRSKTEKMAILFSVLSFILSVASASTLLIPAGIVIKLFQLSCLAAFIGTVTAAFENRKRLATMDAQDYYLNEKNKEDLNNFANSGMCKKFSM
jgi:hypothetical protein